MSRAPFNTTADFWSGPDTVAGSAFRFGGNVRFVPADGITWVDAGIPNVVGWITVDASKPFGGWDPVRQLLIPAMGDLVKVPSGGAFQYWVVAVDEVLWGSQPLYYRAHVANLPLPAFVQPVWCKAFNPVFGNIITTNLVVAPTLVPGMRALHPGMLPLYYMVTAVALPFVTVNKAFGPAPLVVDMCFD